MKSEKGSEIITTICEYENSVAMPDNERLTYLDTCGIAHIKDGKRHGKGGAAAPFPMPFLRGFRLARKPRTRGAATSGSHHLRRRNQFL